MAFEETGISRRDIALVGAGLAALSLPATDAQARSGKNRAVRIPAEDRLDIIELMARYAWAYDTGHIDGFLDTFTEDGTMIGFGKLIGGKAEIRPFLVEGLARRGEAGWQHLTDHHVFRDYTGDTCTVFSFYTMMEADSSGANGRVRAMGYYTSHCRKEKGEWLFARREVTRWDGKRPW